MVPLPRTPPLDESSVLLLTLAFLAACTEPPHSKLPAGDSGQDAGQDTGPPNRDGLVEHGAVTCADPTARDRLGPLEDPVLLPAPLEDKYETGFTVGDIDGDGRRDLWIATGSMPQLLLQQEDGSFAEARERVETRNQLEVGMISLLDLDGDGDLDAFLGRAGHYNRVYENVGGGFFERRRETGVEVEAHNTRGASWADMDGDGDLDLAIANDRADQQPPDPGHPNRLLERVDTWTWVDVSDRLPEESLLGYSKFAEFFDHDEDGAPDLYVINHLSQYTGNHLLMGDGTGQFTAAPELGLDVRMSGMGFDAADINGDLLADMVIADQYGVVLFVSDGNGGWYDASAARGLVFSEDQARVTAWSSTWSDVNNDGLVDVFSGFGPTSSEGYEGDTLLESQPDALWIQQPDGQFVEDSAAWGLDDTEPNRAAAVVDLNGDGWLDVVRSAHHGPKAVLRARCGAASWLMVDLAGPTLNPHGLGAKVTITVGETTQTRWIREMSAGYLASQPPEAHFGLGEATVVDELRVVWPGGEQSVYRDVAAFQRVTVAAPSP